MLEKQPLLHKSTLDQMAAEKKELTMKMEKVISNERDVGHCLMKKVEELNIFLQTLNTTKLQLN